LGLLSLRACHGRFGVLRAWPTLAAVTVTVSYAALDELHQGQVAGRHASVLDWAADLSGALLAVLFVACLGILRVRLAGARSVGETET
jgi:VanZ family protein